MFENLPDILDQHFRLKAVQNATPIESRLERMFTSGQFKAANERQGVWARSLNPTMSIGVPSGNQPPLEMPEGIKPARPVLMAGMPIGVGGKGNTNASKMLDELDAEAAQPFNAPNAVLQGKSLPPLPQPGEPLYSQEEIRKRLGPARSTPKSVDPYEGMDSDLRKAMEAEDKRIKRNK